MNAYRGYAIKSDKVEHWHSILEEWLLVIERYSRHTGGGDSPFGYRERANVGLLSAAAWRAGRVAIEEFAHEKKKGEKGGKKLGRADLKIISSTTVDLVETKFDWISLTGHSLVKTVQRKHEKVIRDASRSKERREYDNTIGVSFFGIYLKGQNVASMDQLIVDEVKSLSTEGFYDLLAWCFPPQERKAKTPEGDYTPGVILIGSLVGERPNKGLQLDPR